MRVISLQFKFFSVTEVKKEKNKLLKGEYCHPAYLTLYVESIIRNAGLDEAQTGIKIAGRIINNNLRYADDTTLMAESKEELESL